MIRRRSRSPRSTVRWAARSCRFSYELGQDWATLQTELTGLISDARDVLDATQFLTGTGTDSPAGVLTGLSTSQRVQTVGAAAIAIGDVYALKQALPARFMASATWAVHPTRIDAIYRLTPSGSTTEPQAMPARDGELIGRPVIEWTTMSSTSATGQKWMLYGDFHSAFFVADRLGMSVEIVQNLFGRVEAPDRRARAYGVLADWLKGRQPGGLAIRRGSVMAGLVGARESFACTFDDREIVVRVGDQVPADYLLEVAITTAARYDTAKSGNGYSFPSFVTDIMNHRVVDFFRSRQEGFRDGRYYDSTRLCSPASWPRTSRTAPSISTTRSTSPTSPPPPSG